MDEETADFRVLSILNVLIDKHDDWIGNEVDVFDTIRKLWNDKSFRYRYDIRRMPDAQTGEIFVENIKSTKFDVPKLCVRIIQVRKKVHKTLF